MISGSPRDAGPNLGAEARPARVAHSEAELLNLTRALLTPHTRYIRSLRVHAEPHRKIDTIGPTAMGLLQRTLARGVCYQLLRRGGWQRRRTLVDGSPRQGRLWDRHETLPPLEFGPPSFALLRWLHEQDVGAPTRALAHPPRTALGLGDELLFYIAAEQVCAAGGRLTQPAFAHSALCQLGFADALAGGEPLPTLDFRALTHGPGAIVLEALQGDLAQRWLKIEDTKQAMVDLDAMIALGHAQDQILAGLVRAVDLAQPRRRDLCGFLAEFGHSFLARGPHGTCPDARILVRSLDLRAPLSARQAAFHAALAGVRGVLLLERWLDEAGLVAHFDEGYEAAQLLLSLWAPLRRVPHPRRQRPGRAPETRTIFERGHALAHSLQSLHSLGAPPPSPSSPPPSS